MLTAIVAILIAAVPATFAQDEATKEERGRKRCSPAGVWYGGSVDEDIGLTFSWIMTVTPAEKGTYNITGDNGFSWDVPLATSMSGVLKKVSRNRYEYFLIGLQDPVGTFPPFNPPLILAVHGYMEQDGCDSFTVEYDLQAFYLWGMVPN